jgi:outer membrane protein assembly factor BamB
MRHLTFFLPLVLVLNSSASDWPCWRGPSGLGVSPAKNVPLEWAKDKNVVWKAMLPGKGASSPVVIGNRVYVTTQTPDTALHVLAIDREQGKVVWDREVGRGKLKANNLHNMSTPTPVGDGRRVYVMFGTGDFAALNQDGEIVWQRNLVTEYGKYNFNHGYGSSPMLLNDRLYVVCLHQGPSYLLAVDAGTGQNVWKKDRNLESKDEAQDSYSSPIWVQKGTGTELVLAGAETISGYDPKSGDEIWRFGGLKVPHPYGRTIAGPTAADGVIVVVASGFQNRGYTVALKDGGKGNITETHKMWSSSKYSADCPTPVILGGKLFSIRDDGMATCLDLKTGEPYWQERLFSENVKVSPIAAEGKIYFTSNQANTTVVNAAEKFQVLATNKLNEATLATPAVADGKLFIRTDGNLYCVGNSSLRAANQ